MTTATGDTLWTGVARLPTGREIRVMAKNDVAWLLPADDLAMREVMAWIPASGV
jgi:hypothetical protein